MAKHKARRNSKFQALPINIQIALTTLGNAALLATAMTALGTTKFRTISADLQWSLRGSTPGEGPLQVGLANGNLTGAEIIENLDANPSSQNDIIALEWARRPVRRSGAFAVIAANETLNDGKPIRTKLRTYLDEGVELNAWVRNQSGAVLTTGAIVTIQGTLYGVWV